MRIKDNKKRLGAALALAFAGSHAAHGNEVESLVSASLCSSTNIEMALVQDTATEGSMEGEGGVGWGEAALIKATVAIKVEGELSAAVKMSSQAVSETCVDMLGLDANELSAEMREAYYALMSEFGVQYPSQSSQINLDQIGISLLKSAPSFNLSNKQSGAGLDMVSDVIDLATETLSGNAGPLEIVNSMATTAVKLQDFLHPSLVAAMQDIEGTMAKKLASFDAISRSCDDIHAGKITHLSVDLQQQFLAGCDVYNSLINEVADELDKIQSIGEDAIPQLQVAFNDVSSLGGQLMSSIGELGSVSDLVSSTAESASNKIHEATYSIKVAGESIVSTIESGEQVVNAGLNQVENTKNSVQSVANSALSTAQQGKTLVSSLNGTTSSLKSTASNLASTASREAIQSVCSFEKDFGLTTVSVKDILGSSIC